jgi:predicted lysophospholipase L1 biosynthesis ABC-type transport system permease subunit
VAEAREERSRVAIVNETMARRYWADGDPLGTTISLVDPQGAFVPHTIVGVAADVAQRQLPAAPENQVYLPLGSAREVSLVVRTNAAPSAHASVVRRAIAGLDPTLPVSLQTMTEAYAWYTWDRRGQGLVIAALGAIALLLAALGVYGVMSLLVTSRRREIGVRMALGGTPSAIHRMIVGAGFRLSAGGLAVGLLLAAASTNGLASIYYAVRPFDARVLTLSAGLLAASALMASWWPARRAMRTDPMAVLKSER